MEIYVVKEPWKDFPEKTKCPEDHDVFFQGSKPIIWG